MPQCPFKRALKWNVSTQPCHRDRLFIRMCTRTVKCRFVSKLRDFLRKSTEVIYAIIIIYVGQMMGFFSPTDFEDVNT